MKIKALLGLVLALGLSCGFNVQAAEDSGVEEVPAVEVEFYKEGDNVERKGKPVILDMDYCTDVDDACALRLAEVMHQNGEIDLKAVSLCVLGENNIASVHGMLCAQGLGGIPIGRSALEIWDVSPYWNVTAAYSDGNINIDESVRLWRKVISQSERKVDIVTTGYLTNLSEFCKSQPDDISTRSGLELLDNVGNIYIVGGAWEEGLCNNFFFEQAARESLDWLLKNVDKKMFFISSDCGGPVICGGRVIQNNRDDILSKALLEWGTDYGRAAWDPMGVYICAVGDSEALLNNSALGVMPVDLEFDVTTGVNKFTQNPSGKHYRVYRLSDDLNYYSELLDSYCIVQ